MVVRAIRISDKAHLKKEIDHLADVFLRNGYNENQYKKIVTKAMMETKRKEEKREDNYEGKKIFLPYIKGTTDKMAKKLKERSLESSSLHPTQSEKWSIHWKTLSIQVHTKASTQSHVLVG